MHLAFMLPAHGAFYATKKPCNTEHVALFCLVDRHKNHFFCSLAGHSRFSDFSLHFLPNCYHTTTGKQLNTHAPPHKEFLSSGQRFSVPRCKTKRYENSPSFHLQSHWWTSCEKNCTTCTKSLSSFYLCIYLLSIHWVLKSSYFVFLLLCILCCSVLMLMFFFGVIFIWHFSILIITEALYLLYWFFKKMYLFIFVSGICGLFMDVLHTVYLHTWSWMFISGTFMMFVYHHPMVWSTCLNYLEFCCKDEDVLSNAFLYTE